MKQTIYCRKEPTTDSVALKYAPDKAPKLRDVVAYADRKATVIKAVWPYYYSNKPTRRNKTAMLNCYRWNVVWLKDLVTL